MDMQPVLQRLCGALLGHEVDQYIYVRTYRYAHICTQNRHIYIHTHKIDIQDIYIYIYIYIYIHAHKIGMQPVSQRLCDVSF